MASVKLYKFLLPPVYASLTLFFIACQQNTQFSKEDLYVFNDAVNDYQNRKFDDALEKIKKLKEVNGENLELLNLEGKIFFYTRNFELAHKSFSHIVKSNPDSPSQLIWLGKVQAAENPNSDLALSTFQKVIQIDPENSQAYYYLARLLEKKENYKDAIVAYNRSLQAEYQISKSHLRLGILLKKMDLIDRANIHFSRVISMNVSESDVKQAKALQKK